MKAIVALDIGTSGTKATLLTRKGDILDSQYAGYSTAFEGSRVEQNPQDWWQAVCDTMRRLLSSRKDVALELVVLSGQMQDIILVMEDGSAPPAILYSDMRAQDEARAAAGRIGAETLQQVTGNLQDASSLTAKLLWIKKHQPERYSRAKLLFLGAHDYITWRLCGAHTSDLTTAATTGLMDLSANDWGYSVLDALDLRSDWLPKLAAAGERSGMVSASAAAQTGLPQSLPVIHGAGDAGTATVGAGAGEPGRYYAYLGTSGWLASTREGSLADPNLGIFNLRHPDGKRLILIGPMLTAAGNFEWLRQEFGELEQAVRGSEDASAYDLLNDTAAESPPGSNGLLYLPHLAGERAPFRDPNARGVFFGLKSTSIRGDLYRAVLEGVALSMRSIREAIAAGTGERIDELNLIGGGAKSALWPQIFADVFNCPVNVMANPEDAGARGAAIIAGKALGWYASYLPEGAFFPTAARCQPQPEAVEIYNRLHPVFANLYPTLKASFEQLAAALGTNPSEDGS